MKRKISYEEFKELEESVVKLAKIQTQLMEEIHRTQIQLKDTVELLHSTNEILKKGSSITHERFGFDAS